MNKLLSVSATAVFLLFSSCNISSDKIIPDTVPKEGTGIIQDREFNLTFNEISVAQGIRAEIAKADTEKVVVTAPEDLMEDIVVEVKNGRLAVHFKSGIRVSAKNVSVKIFAKDFSAVKASSAAKITVKDTFTQERMEVDVSSSGSINGNFEAKDLSVDASSSGLYRGKIWAVKLDGEASSSGKVDLSGKTENAEISVSSAGNFNAADVTSEQAEISASSAGTASLSVSRTLNAAASSAGRITVIKKGPLQITAQKESSGGRITVTE